MGLAASQGRIMLLVGRKSDIEFKVQIINQRRTVLAEQSARLARDYANLMYQDDASSHIGDDNMVPGFTNPTTGITIPQTNVGTGVYEAEMAEVQALDKELELREKTLQTQNKEVETEMEVLQKIIDKNIERGFKTLG